VGGVKTTGEKQNLVPNYTDHFWQGTTSPPKEATSRSLNPWEESRLKEAAISRVAAATVKVIEVSPPIRYKLLGITAIGHREQAEFFR